MRKLVGRAIGIYLLKRYYFSAALYYLYDMDIIVLLCSYFENAMHYTKRPAVSRMDIQNMLREQRLK